MKTFLAVFTKEKLPDKEAAQLKHYTFNTEKDIKIGDLIQSDRYNTPIQVFSIFDESKKFVNVVTGELSDKRVNNRFVEIVVV